MPERFHNCESRFRSVAGGYGKVNLKTSVSGRAAAVHSLVAVNAPGAPPAGLPSLLRLYPHYPLLIPIISLSALRLNSLRLSVLARGLSGEGIAWPKARVWRRQIGPFHKISAGQKLP